MGRGLGARAGPGLQPAKVDRITIFERERIMLDKLTSWIRRGAASAAKAAVIDGTRQGVREAIAELTVGRLSLVTDEPLLLAVPVEEPTIEEDEVLEKPKKKKVARKKTTKHSA